MSDLRSDRSARPAPPSEKAGGSADGPRRMITAGIALAAVAVFGIGIWFAYDQGVKRGASGAPPLVRADQSPTKVAPENPGGLQVPNQDRQIYERLGSGPQAAPGQERVLPPSERPLPSPPPGVSSGAASGSSSTAQATPGPAVTIPNRPAPAGVPNQTTAPSPAVTSPPGANTVATPPRVANVAPIGNAQPPSAPAATPQSRAGTQPAASAPANPRPAASQTAPQTAPQAAVQPAAGGSARVQLASLKDQREAQATWGALQKKFPAELGALTASYERVDLGDKGIYFRLQAGPLQNRAAAQVICERLSAARQGCIVVGR